MPDSQPTSSTTSAAPPGLSAAEAAGVTSSKLLRSIKRLAGRKERIQLLPTLIRVHAGFSRVGGELSEEEIESSLGFLRYDYPEGVFREMADLYRKALRETQNLNELARELERDLPREEKILLAVQICVLISHNRLKTEEWASFVEFSEVLGIRAEAEVLARELAVSLPSVPEVAQGSPGVLERLEIGPQAGVDLVWEQLGANRGITAFRHEGLILVKNTGSQNLIARGQTLRPGQFARLYDGQRVLLGGTVFDFQDLNFYFNAKKGVSAPQLYLGMKQNGETFVEKVRTKGSLLRIRFGLTVEVEALQASSLLVGEKRLPVRQKLVVSLSERIRFPDKSEVIIADLRRRARELGGRFDLNPSKTEYLVSNNASLLGQGDILLSPHVRTELLLRISCNYQERRGVLHVERATSPISVNRQTVKESCELRDNDVIVLGEGQFLRCHFTDRIIEEERNLIRKLEVEGVSHRYGPRNPGLDEVSLSVQRGEMICVMGPSGCGKSTLLRVLAGHLRPQQGEVRLNGRSLYGPPGMDGEGGLAKLAPLISFIPHEEAFDPLLTVEENLRLAGMVRSPHLPLQDMERRVRAKLMELGLQERRDVLPGDPEDKRLSGGERKRLNVGMDMISQSDVFLFDEPTSGLSSKDSEHVLEIIRSLAHNKIVFVSIHQPSSRLFHLFHKALLLDKGGKVVFFGRPQEMLDYFRKAWEEEIGGQATDDGEATPNDGQAGLPSDPKNPEFVFDVLETPLRDLSGETILEEDDRGHTAQARRFPPNFWRDRFATRSVVKAMSSQRETISSGITSAIPVDAATRTEMPQPETAILQGWQGKLRVLGAMWERAFRSKLRNKGNLAMTLLESPLLAILIAMVLKFGEEANYTFASAFHIPTYLFLSLVVAMFLGLTNSANDILRDRVMLTRERNHNKNVGGYLMGKFLALSLVSLVQCGIYLAVGNWILEIRDMWLTYLFWMVLTSLSGVSIGLLVSSLVRDGRTAINIIPLVLVPQIILGGALIKYEEMNRNLDFVHSIRKWLQPSAIAHEGEPSKLKVPALCQFMPLRWSYESIVLLQAYSNPMDAALEEINSMLEPLKKKAPGPDGKLAKLSDEEQRLLDQGKDALVLISALEERNTDALLRRLNRIMEEVRGGTFELKRHLVKDAQISAEEAFQNKKVADLVSNAEFEVGDYHRLVGERKIDPQKVAPPNVFFGKQKHLFGQPITTLRLNIAAMAMFILLPLVLVYLNLKRQLRRVR